MISFCSPQAIVLIKIGLFSNSSIYYFNVHGKRELMNKPSKLSAWEFFQSLGKTFMLPVALLSFSGIMLGIGSSLSSQAVIELLPFLNNTICLFVFTWMSKIGSFGFTFLPVMFAIAIPLGLARQDKGVAAFAGFVGYVVMNLAINFCLTERGIILPNGTVSANAIMGNDLKMILGIQSVDTGILGALFSGVIVYFLHEKYRTIRLPDAFSFFGGVRFVAIITALTMGIIGLTIPFIWPYFAFLIQKLGLFINQAGEYASFIFGTGERLLLPFGLHHILVALIRFTQAGGSIEVCGNNVQGALTIFQAELACPTVSHFSEQATQFLSQGKMPAFLGGLPGAALAMYHTARPENRKKVKGLLLSGVVACMVGGITEPLEFLFLFAFPILYVIHAVLTGLGFMTVALLGVTIGNTDGNLIDFIVFGILQGSKTNWYFIPVLALIWFTVYYFIFRYMIVRFNVKTPGRDINTDSSDNEYQTSSQRQYNATAILAALGGKENIVSLDNCITRLRLVLNDLEKIDEPALKEHGALGVVRLKQNNLQVIIGTQVQSVKDGLDTLIQLP